MELKSQIARVYLGGAFQVNLSANLGRLLQAHGWKNKEEVYASFNQETGEVVISKNPQALILKEMKNENAEREICTDYYIKPLSGEPDDAGDMLLMMV